MRTPLLASTDSSWHKEEVQLSRLLPALDGIAVEENALYQMFEKYGRNVEEQWNLVADTKFSWCSKLGDRKPGPMGEILPTAYFYKVWLSFTYCL